MNAPKYTPKPYDAPAVTRDDVPTHDPSEPLVQLNISAPGSMRLKLRKMALDERTTVSELVVQAVWRMLDGRRK